jgi:hypothetical protein
MPFTIASIPASCRSLIVSGCRERQYGRRVRLASAPDPTRILRSAPGLRTRVEAAAVAHRLDLDNR